MPLKILCDSREKWTQQGSADTHISKYFQQHGVDYEIVKLDVADYMIEGQPQVAVDRKKSVDEIATNLLSRDDSCRFWREVRRAAAQKIKLVVLIECGGKYKTVNDLKDWHSKYSGVSGRRLIAEMTRCEYAYGVVFKFCDKRSTARRIIELLTEYGTDKGGDTVP